MTKPNPNEAEVTLIGTGGYGECIVIHIGDDKWAIVDSCISPETKRAICLDYLDSINVPYSSVVIVICTHWHDDHILGLSQVLNECVNAAFYTAGAQNPTNFYSLLAYDHLKINNGPNNSATSEFNKCLEVLKKRNIRNAPNIYRAYENCLIYRNNISDTKIFSLSPSEKTVQDFDIEILEILRNYQSNNVRIPHSSPNSKSIVLFIHLGFHRALLGADMEVGNDIEAGWLKILNNINAFDKKASLYKIPHHGSNNGYTPDIWNILLDDENVVAKMTPYNKGHKLPTDEMVEKYKSHTKKLFITKESISKSSKKRNKSITKMITDIGLDINEIKFVKGVIQSRISIDNKDAIWQVSLFENALKLE